MKNADIETYMTISEAWGLTPEENLALFGWRSRQDFDDWMMAEDDATPPDFEQRLPLVIGIHNALRALLPDSAQAYEWIRQPNHEPFFGGLSAIEYIADRGIAGLHRVHRYLMQQVSGR